MNRACLIMSGTVPRRFGRWALAATLCGLLAACSLPDWLDPFGDDEQEAAQLGGATYAQASAYPNLAGVPSEAPRPTSDDLRDTLIKGLIADRDNARYTDEALTAESTAVPPAPSPPKGKRRVDISWETSRVVPEGQEAEEAQGVEIEWETAAGVEPAEAVADESAVVPDGGTQLLAVIYFANETPELNDKDRAVLRDVLSQQEETGGRLHLVSHSASSGESDDSVAQRMVDLDLSLKRANAVATTLLDLGAAQDKLLVEAKMEAEPAAGETGSGGAGGDRKVEIFLEY